MANYTVPADDWVDIETLMDDAYDSSKDYSLYVNQIAVGLLQIDSSTTKPTERGIELPSFATYSIGKGAGATFWLKASSRSPINIVIYEKSA